MYSGFPLQFHLESPDAQSEQCMSLSTQSELSSLLPLEELDEPLDESPEVDDPEEPVLEDDDVVVVDVLDSAAAAAAAAACSASASSIAF